MIVVKKRALLPRFVAEQSAWILVQTYAKAEVFDLMCGTAHIGTLNREYTTGAHRRFRALTLLDKSEATMVLF